MKHLRVKRSGDGNSLHFLLRSRSLFYNERLSILDFGDAQPKVLVREDKKNLFEMFCNWRPTCPKWE